MSEVFESRDMAYDTATGLCVCTEGSDPDGAVPKGVPNGAKSVVVVLFPFLSASKRPKLDEVLTLMPAKKAALLSPPPSLDSLDFDKVLVREYRRDTMGRVCYIKGRTSVALPDCLRDAGYAVSFGRREDAGSIAWKRPPPSPEQKQTSLNREVFSPDSQGQTSKCVLMVSPTAFESNAETSVDNHFMKPGWKDARDCAVGEFEELHRRLSEEGVNVVLFTHQDRDGTPDACFPNNWFSSHSASETHVGTLVLYPMKAPSRRAERRADMVHVLRQSYTTVVDLTAFEDEGKYLEGTGCLILDRVRRVAYVGISERAHPDVVRVWAERLGYSVVDFHATDASGNAIYHTNVMMALGTSVAVVCAEAVADATERNKLMTALGKHHEVIEITRSQVDEFCGNVLEVQGTSGRFMCMSARARAAFTQEQTAVLLKHVSGIISADVKTIEDIGGGGVRCTLGELF